MSSFEFKARKRKTGEVVTGIALDDYFGRHEYGYQVRGNKLTMRSKLFNKRYELLTDEDDENHTAAVLDAMAAMTNDEPQPETLEDVQAREFIITDSCAWEANRKSGAFHPHSIEVVDTVTGQIRHIASGAKIKFIEGGITSSRTQAEYNHMHKE